MTKAAEQLVNLRRPTLQEIGEGLHRRGIFTGGPPEHFELMGRLQFAVLIREGLLPNSRLLDIGCGCLRGGYWAIRFLDCGCYFGVEPNRNMVNAGIYEVLEPGLFTGKEAWIHNNADFDFAVFNTKFDVFLARSIWTHAAKWQIEKMLGQFVQLAGEGAFFLASYLPARWPWEDYKGAEYRGKSHVSNQGDLIRHSRKWVENACRVRGLHVRELEDGVMYGQKWLKITKHPQPAAPYER